MEKKSWYDMLKDPRWQKKRLKIMERNEFTCEDCGATDKTLHVHHGYYEKGIAPWEYSGDTLHCLCETCHKETGNTLLLIQRQLGRIALSDLLQVLGYLCALEALEFPFTSIPVLSFENATGIGDAWKLSEEDIIENEKDGVIDGYRLNALRKGKKKK
jgi:hypothetical protein